MSEKLKKHLANLGEAKLAPWLGPQVMDLIRRIGEEALDPTVLAGLLVTSRGAQSVLRDEDVRRTLIEDLSDDDARNLCTVLNLGIEAPKMTLKGVVFTKPNTASTLFEWFQIAFEGEQSLEQESSRNLTSKDKLLKYQELAYRKLRRIIEGDASKVLVHMPLGAGKLRTVATAVLEAFRSDSENSVVLWLASGECLCEEALSELEAGWQQFGLRDVTSYRLFGRKRIDPIDDLSGAIVVADISNLVEASESWRQDGADVDKSYEKFGLNVRYIILSDAENIHSDEVKFILEKVPVGGRFNLIGISSAPCSVIEPNSSHDILHGGFGGNLVEIDEPDAMLAVRSNGDVDPVDVILFASPIDELSGPLNALTLPEELADRLALDVERNKVLLDKLIALAADDGRIVFYATTAEQARMFAGLLALMGTSASAVTGAIPRNQRSREVAKFNSDPQKQVLCIHGILVSAAEVEQVTAVLLALPTPSAALLHGMVGRLAFRRKNSGQPLKVYAIQDPVPEYLRLIENLDRWDRLPK